MINRLRAALAGCCQRKDSRPFTVFVKSPTGLTIKLEVSPGDKIVDVKRQIEVKEGVPIAHQTLIHAGKTLDDERYYCADKIGQISKSGEGPIGYGLGDDVTLHLIIRVKGGA